VSIEQRAAEFRRLHEGPGAFVMPNPWDVGSARVLAGLGYPALATTSGGLAYVLGRRDGEAAVSRDEALEHSAVIAGATDLPVNGDLENGFGDDPESVATTILGAAAAGLVGCSIEDSTSTQSEPIYPLSHAVERIAAGVEAAATLLAIGGQAVALVGHGVFALPEQGMRRQRARQRGHDLGLAPTALRCRARCGFGRRRVHRPGLAIRVVARSPGAAWRPAWRPPWRRGSSPHPRRRGPARSRGSLRLGRSDTTSGRRNFCSAARR